MELLERMFQSRREQIKDKWRKRYGWLQEERLEEIANNEMDEIRRSINPLHCNYDD